MDRFEQGLPDIQDMPVIATCGHCGDSMYWHMGNMRLCDYCSDSQEIAKECEEE